MRHLLFSGPQDAYSVAVLVKSSSFNKLAIESHYVKPMAALGISPEKLIGFTLEYNEHGKAPTAFLKEYLNNLMPALQSLGVKTLYTTDSAYFKVLTRQAKAEIHLGYVLPCKLTGYEHMQVVLGLNYNALIYNPDLQPKLDKSLATLASSLDGTYQPPGCDIIHSACYPSSIGAIKEMLSRLHAHPALTCDIEGFSLRFWEAGIGTISFAVDQHNGIAFACDYQPLAEKNAEGHYGEFVKNSAVRALLLEFFLTYKGELTFHHAPYDVKAIIYALWMDDLADTESLLTGLDCMTARMHDTKIIAYLATNSTAGNVLELKALAHEFAGNWAKEDIKDIRLIPLDDLLQYNLIDALATWFTRGKHYPVMVADQQEQLYKEMMLPSLKLIIQMELTGMPMNKAKIQEVKAELTGIRDTHKATIMDSQVVQGMNLLVQTRAMEAANAKLKTKQHPLEKFKDLRFNPNSGPQLQILLYQSMGLPVLDLTDTKQPATGADTLKKLINHATDPAHKAVIQAIISYSQADTILATFIPSFEAAIARADDGIVWLYGSFNLGGTVSGRLSSSDPNLQNIPANSIFGKLIKSLFMAVVGWLFCGADFNSLEDYVSALTTKDKNKLKVYEQGFDGHCLRAAFYYDDQLPHIDKDDPKSVNSIKKTHPELRQDSKTPTFLLTYGGTYMGLMSNEGWDEEKAQRIEAKYHELYAESDAYVQSRLAQASKDGYVEVAFGLRLRTPLLKQVMFGSRHVPYEAAAEGRTAGNALGQSYGLLNNRAAVDFWRKVWASPYRLDILPCALIHDAIYALIRDDVEVVEWANRELIKSMQWQELPELRHDTVKLGAALDIFWPDWAHPTTLPNNADQASIIEICRQTKEQA
jgi:DNA polymerase-1